MSTEENKAIVQRYQEAYNNNDLDALDDIVSPDIKTPFMVPGYPPGLEGAKQMQRDFVAGVPDFQASIEDMVAEGDKVVARLKLRGTQTGEMIGYRAKGKLHHLRDVDLPHREREDRRALGY